jgi:putative membrane-bound dehydrogenase-like protein
MKCSAMQGNKVDAGLMRKKTTKPRTSIGRGVRWMALSLFFMLGSISIDTAARGEDFPKVYDSEKDETAKRLSPQEAAAGFRTAPGFKVNVFAAEPDVQNPIAMAWDGRGRLWVAENYTYAERPKKFELALRDRIVIFTDRDGDGRFDERKVFADDLQMLTSLEVGLGGVWVMCPPQVLFIPDRDGDDKPDGPGEAVLDGFTVPPENYHNFANGLHWGPDGWLYGRCGASSPGRVGVPGTAEAQRVPLQGGVWRYQPQRKTFEALCHGTTNPWGHDWNEHGEAFFINTVNGHLWHVIPGAHYRRPHTIDPNPRVYEPMEMHADHWHWDTGKDWSDSRNVTGEHDRRGGGHAHSGTMIYLADQWPAEYRGRLLTLNMHGRRANVEKLERHGSGYVAGHDPDTLFAADPWFRGIELGYGPDGSVFILDWSDTGECHEATGVHRTSGRIFRVSYGKPAPQVTKDVTKCSEKELVELHRHKNEWYARQARQQLADRQAAGQKLSQAREELRELLESSEDVVVRLRALWSFYVIGAADRALLEALLADRDEHVRTWAVRLLTDAWPLDTIFGPTEKKRASVDEALVGRFERLAREDDSGLVRLALASTLQRLPVSQRSALAQALLARSEDAGDQNLPLLIWYGLIPVGDENLSTLVQIGAGECFQLVRRFIARRLAEELDKHPVPLNDLLSAAAKKSDAFRLDVLTGLTEGLAGWHKAPKPAAWDALSTAVSKTSPAELQELSQGLSVVFGDGRALEEVRRLALDGKADMNKRRAALQTLIENRPPDLREVCEKLLGTRFLNTIAVRGLAAFDDPALGEKLARSYRAFHHSERSAVMETLVARPTFAKALLEEMAAGKIQRSDLSPFQARQIRSFNDAKLTGRLTEVWGEVRDSSAEKQSLIAKLKTELTTERLAAADRSNGRLVFHKACANCHRLFGAGGEVGPDLTGAGRQNLDYLLGNMIDPSAVVTADFRMSVLVLEDGRILNGILSQQNARTVTVQTAKERFVLGRADIESISPSPMSLMPDNLLQPLSDVQIRDLFAYLMSPSQVALPEGATVEAIGTKEVSR